MSIHYGERSELQLQMTRAQLIAAMLEGLTFEQVSKGVAVPVKRAMDYRLLCAVRTHGAIALQDGRHGHPSKLCGEARAFLEASCREVPRTPSLALQTALRELFNLQVSVSQINRVRATLGVSNPSRRSPQEKKTETEASLAHPEWQEGAGSLLLLAAASETQLLSCLEMALTPKLSTVLSELRIQALIENRM